MKGWSSCAENRLTAMMITSIQFHADRKKGQNLSSLVVRRHAFITCIHLFAFIHFFECYGYTRYQRGREPAHTEVCHQ